MVADSNAGSRRLKLGIGIGLVVASALTFFASASLAGLALVGVLGGAIKIDSGTAVALLLAAWLALAGVEMLRRRHFAFAVLTPLALALVDLAYVLTTGRAEGLGGVVMMLIPVLLVAGSRQAFRD